MPSAKRLLVPAALAIVALLLSSCIYTGASKPRQRNSPTVQAQAKCQSTKINNTRAGR